MKAIVLKQQNSYPVYDADYPDPVAGEGEVLVKLRHAALNRRDYWITQGKYPNIQVPVILGSDGCGKIGDRRVLLYPAINWGKSRRVQADNFEPLGMPKNGTLAEYIAVDKSYVYDAPEYLSDAEAACIGMAGLTAYRALFSRGELKAGDRVLINGVGGGVALMACQLAIAAQAEVYVTSGSANKIDQAVKLGAKAGFNYREENWHKKALAEGLLFDVIIDSAGGPGFANLIKVAAPGGRLVTYGGTHGALDHLNTQIIFWRQLSILGTTMGSPSEFKDLLHFITRHQIMPVIDRLYYWDMVEQGFNSLRDSTQFGKVVFSLE
jgi:NADPH:quinone reductase-like Zn-dependent oxidoreductase